MLLVNISGFFVGFLQGFGFFFRGALVGLEWVLMGFLVFLEGAKKYQTDEKLQKQ